MPELRIRERQGRAPVYYIHHGRHQESTGTSDPKQAQLRLAAYLAKDDVGIQRSVPALTTIGTMMDDLTSRSVNPAHGQRAKDLARLDARLRPFWGELLLSDVTPDACERYRVSRVRLRRPMGPAASGTVRGELKRLQTITNAFCETTGVKTRPVVVLPPAGAPRSRWLWRSEVARLLLAARGRIWNENRGDWERHPDGRLTLVDPEQRARLRPLVRLILVASLSGTREDDIVQARWRRSPSHGYFDLARANFHRRGSGRTKTSKRAPPVRICPELFRLVESWAAADAARGFDHLIHDDNGKAIATTTLLGRFRKVRRRAGLDADVKVHSLRHTCATWLLLGGASLEDTASYLGLTVRELEKTYAQVDPAFTVAAAEALNEWGRLARAVRTPAPAAS